MCDSRVCGVVYMCACVCVRGGADVLLAVWMWQQTGGGRPYCTQPMRFVVCSLSRRVLLFSAERDFVMVFMPLLLALQFQPIADNPLDDGLASSAAGAQIS